MDLKNINETIKLIINNKKLLGVSFFTTLILNIVLINDLLVFMKPLNPHMHYLILINLMFFILYTSINLKEYSDNKVKKKEKISKDLIFKKLSENFDKSEIEIISILIKGPAKINHKLLKSGNLSKIAVLEKNNILKIHSRDIIFINRNQPLRGHYFNYLCELTDDYKEYLKNKP